MSHLLALPAPRIIVRPRLDEASKPVLDESGRHIHDVDQIVDPLFGLDLALQSVTSGPKLFETWSLRKRIKELRDPEDARQSARYLLLDDAEKEILLQGVKTIDWTFGNKLRFWTEWEAFFDALSGITVYDDKNPPVAYVAWKTAYEADQAAKTAAKAEAERKVLEAAEVAKAEREAGIQALLDAASKEALADLKRQGILGSAATIADLSPKIQSSLREAAERDYDSGVRWISAPEAEPECAPAQETTGDGRG